MCSLLRYFAVLHNINSVGIDGCWQAVRDEYNSLLAFASREHNALVIELAQKLGIDAVFERLCKSAVWKGLENAFFIHLVA